MATLVELTVGPDTSDDYASLNAFLTNYGSKDLVAADIYLHVGCKNFQDTTNITGLTSSWKGDSTRYCKIYGLDPVTSVGEVTTDSYRLQTTAPVPITGNAGGMVWLFEDIQIHPTSGNTHCLSGSGTMTASATFRRCLLRAHNAASGGYFAYTGRSGSPVLTFENFIMTGNANGVIYSPGWDNTLVLRNGLILQTGSNFYTVNYGNKAGTVLNCYANTGNGSFAAWYQCGSVSRTKDASNDTSASTTALQSIPFNTDTFTNVTDGTYDFRLPVGSSLIDAGNDASGYYTQDLLSNLWGTYDIGPIDPDPASTHRRNNIFVIGF